MPRHCAAGLVVVTLTTAGCGGGDSKGSSQAATTSSSEIPTTTQRVYLATALACRYLGTDRAAEAHFTPLRVRGQGYGTAIDPTEDCREQRIFNSYVYDVPAPALGKLRITPGNQPTATLDAAKLTASGAATVFYGRKGEGQFYVTVIKYEKDDEVKDAG